MIDKGHIGVLKILENLAQQTKSLLLVDLCQKALVGGESLFCREKQRPQEVSGEAVPSDLYQDADDIQGRTESLPDSRSTMMSALSPSTEWSRAKVQGAMLEQDLIEDFI